MKVAIVHDYLFQYGGAEKCVENWLQIYPEAKIYTTFSFANEFKESKQINRAFKENRVNNSVAQNFFKFTFLRKFQKHLYFLYSPIMRFWKIKNYDLVIVSSTYCGKNVRFENCKKVIFYCHTPTRFLYNLVSKEDQRGINPTLQAIMKIINWPLRVIDQQAVSYLNSINAHILANSKFIQNKIKEIYKVDSKVVYPPVDLQEFSKIEHDPDLKEPFYLYFGRISFHKRLDLAIQACLKLGRKLVIVGTSALESDLNSLKKIVRDYESKNSNHVGLITFTGRVSNEQRNEYLKTCCAMLFPGREDFGIAPVEALAAGVPVIAYEAGGALEYIQHKVNGYFFEKQTTESLQKAILEFEGLKLYSKKIKETAVQFSEDSFRAEFEHKVNKQAN